MKRLGRDELGVSRNQEVTRSQSSGSAQIVEKGRGRGNTDTQRSWEERMAALSRLCCVT